MSDIIDNEELDKDTVTPEELEQLFSKKYNLITTKQVSAKKTYINRINGTDSLKLAVSLSNNTIEVYELSSSSLRQVCRLSGHSKPVTEVVFSPREEHLLYSAGQDGLLKLWDTRASGTCVQEYKDEDEQVLKPYDCMDISCNGRVLCGGSALAQDDAYLVFWDQRQTTPLGGYWNTHTDDITQVKFHKNKVDTLVSGSEDGLLNVYNISEQTEDEALVYSLNVGNSVSCLQWLDDSMVGCVSQGHDFSLWDTDSGDLKCSFDRHAIAKSMRRSRADDCYVGGLLRGGGLLVGSYADSSVLRVCVPEGSKLLPRASLAGSHQTVSHCWQHLASDTLVCVGEEGIISVWAPSLTDGQTHTPHTQRLLTNMKKLHVNRHKPY